VISRRLKRSAPPEQRRVVRAVEIDGHAELLRQVEDPEGAGAAMAALDAIRRCLVAVIEGGHRDGALVRATALGLMAAIPAVWIYNFYTAKQDQVVTNINNAASQMIDWQRQLGHISHKHVAVAAGLGWIGRNNLLVHPQFGCRVRYNTVLTYMVLVPDGPMAIGCGDCRACVASCPASAIRDEQADFDHQGCYEMLQVFKNKRNLGHHICGLCVRACEGGV